jgi:cytochrome P450
LRRSPPSSTPRPRRSSAASPRSGGSITLPPGPRISLLGAALYRPGRDRLAYFTALARDYGDVSHLRLAGEHLVLLTHPTHVRDVLMVNQRQFKKGRALERAKPLLGEGLLTSEQDAHLRQRRLIQPAFHRDRIASYAGVMAASADRLCRQWSDRQVVDISQDMARLTLGIVGKTLFDADDPRRARLARR